MQKQILNYSMMGLIAILAFAVLVLSIKLATRPQDEEIVEQPVTIVEDTPVEDQEPEEIAEEPEVLEPVVEEPVDEKVYVLTNKRVNIRLQPDSTSEKLGTAEVGTTFEALEFLDNGWTKIVYNGADAYLYTIYADVVDGSESQTTTEDQVVQ